MLVQSLERTLIIFFSAIYDTPGLIYVSSNIFSLNFFFLSCLHYFMFLISSFSMFIILYVMSLLLSMFLMSFNSIADDWDLDEGMILAENHSPSNMVRETVQMSRLTNGEAENSLHKQSDQNPRQGRNGRCRNLGSNGTSSQPCYDENGGEVNRLGISTRDASDNLNANMQPDVIHVSGT